MEKLKRQDEERKRRKKEEKERKDREKERLRREEEERRYREEEERERIAAEERRIKDEVDKARREKDESERRKENFEKSIKKIWNGSEIPCLFDSKIAYSKMLYSLPVELEERIRANELPYEDLKFRRYKTLLFPIDGLLGLTSGRCIAEIVAYFLRYSTMTQIDNDEINDDLGYPTTQSAMNLSNFPFKCISMV
jgi:flagellar biosynthesis GTPase FlhF